MKRTLLIALMLSVGCQGEPAPPNAEPAAISAPSSAPAPWVKTHEPFDFKWISGALGEFAMPEIIGGGVALIDYDGDQDLDVYFIQGGDLLAARNAPASNPHQNRLFRNDGQFRFVDVTDETGTGDRRYGMGVAVGDIDNDGDPDLYITNVGRNTMLRNDAGNFVDVTEETGTGDPGWGASAVFFDADLDGDLDLFATNYLDWTPETELTCFNPLGGEDYCSPRNYLSPAIDVFYRNKGDGTFENATVDTGLNESAGTGLGVISADWTGDGYPDLFVANDGMPDFFWASNSGGQWSEHGMDRGCALDDEGIAKAGMGVDTDDIDDDGDLDLIVCNLTGESDSIFRNDGDYFIDMTARTGVRKSTRHATRFGLGWVDLNNDGWLDLFEANGRVMRSADTETHDPYAQHNHLLQGDQRGRFTMVPHALDSSDAQPRTSRAAAFGDLNNDGRIDVVICNRDAPAILLENVTNPEHHYVRIDVIDEHGRPDVGSLVELRLPDRTITRPVQRAGSYMASNEPTVHIGIGPHERYEALSVIRPDGTRQTWPDAAHILNGQFRIEPPISPPSSAALNADAVAPKAPLTEPDVGREEK